MKERESWHDEIEARKSSGLRNDRIKALLWEGDGFLLLYKRLEKGAFRWPRKQSELAEINEEQYRNLIRGLEVELNKINPNHLTIPEIFNEPKKPSSIIPGSLATTRIRNQNF